MRERQIKFGLLLLSQIQCPKREREWKKEKRKKKKEKKKKRKKKKKKFAKKSVESAGEQTSMIECQCQNLFSLLEGSIHKKTFYTSEWYRVKILLERKIQF